MFETYVQRSMRICLYLCFINKEIMKARVIFLLGILISAVNYAQTEFKLDSLHQYEWNVSLNDWKHNTRDLYTYDNGGTKETNLLRLILNGSVWENFYQFNKSYNTDNNLTESILQNWDGSVWVNGSRDAYVYNADGFADVFSYAIFIAGNWVVFNQNNYLYDAMNNEIEDTSTEYDFASMTLINDERLTTEYTNSLKTRETKEVWRTVINNWENEERKDYSYNTNGNLDLLEISTWRLSSMDWSDPYRQSLFTYNASDLPTEILEQLIVSDVWINSTRVLNTYSGDNLTVITFQAWSNSLSIWENENRQLRTFDVDDNLVELIYQTWDEGTNAWVGTLRQVFFWSLEETLSTDVQMLSDNLILYPNPAKQHISVKSDFSIDTMTVYNMQGQQVCSFRNSKHITLPSLSEGLYILELSSGDQRTFKRFVVKQ